MEEFELRLRISESDSKVRTAIGAESYNKLFDAGLVKTRNSCGGCGYRPLDETRIKSILSLHIIDFDPAQPENTTGIPLCKACHTTQHIDTAINNGWIELVNSTHSQKTLIELCRMNVLQNNISVENTRRLKTTPIEFLEKLKLGVIPSSKTKVIFTSDFVWGDL